MGNFYMESTQINYRRDEKLKTVDQKLQELSETSAIDTDIAPVFKSTNTYAPGDMVYYRNKLYVFNVEHTGAWAAADVTATDVTTEVSSLRSGLTNYQTQNDLNLEVPDRKNVIPVTVDNIKTSNTIGTWTGDAYTHKGITYTLESSNGSVTAIKVNGTAESPYSRMILGANLSITGYSGYKMSGAPAGGVDKYSFTCQKDSSPWTVYGTDNGSGGTLSNVSTGTDARFFLQVQGGVEVSNIYFYPMLCPAWADATFAPYIPSVESRIEAVESGVTSLTTTFKAEGSATDLSLWASDVGVVVLSTYIAALDKRVGFKRAADGTISSYVSD